MKNFLKLFAILFVAMVSISAMSSVVEAKDTSYKKICVTNQKTQKKKCRLMKQVKKDTKANSSPSVTLSTGSIGTGANYDSPKPILSSGLVISTGSISNSGNLFTGGITNTGNIFTGDVKHAQSCTSKGIVTWLSTYIQTTYSLEEKNQYCDSLTKGAVYGSKNDYGNHVCVCK